MMRYVTSRAYVVIPRGVDRCDVRFDWFAPEPVPDPNADARWRELVEFSDQVQIEDADICERVHHNPRSRAYRPGPYSPRRESGVHHFHGLLLRSLGQLCTGFMGATEPPRPSVTTHEIE